jgi:hypothetical protein
MKKATLFLILSFFAVGMFTSCEEEEEPAQTLSAFVIGEWYSQVVDMGDVETDIYFLVDIEEDHYTLSMTDGETTIDLPDAGYVVDNDANTITIDKPQFPDDEPSDEVVSFKVTWMEGGDTMTWLPIDPLVNDAPTLVWTRQTGM